MLSNTPRPLPTIFCLQSIPTTSEDFRGCAQPLPVNVAIMLSNTPQPLPTIFCLQSIIHHCHNIWRCYLAELRNTVIKQTTKTDPIKIINLIPDKGMGSFGDYSHSKTNKRTTVKIRFFPHKICHNSDMFRSILVIRRELLNIKKAYIRTQMVKYTKIQTFIAQILMHLITHVFNP
jgi:hypothetical protein